MVRRYGEGALGELLEDMVKPFDNRCGENSWRRFRDENEPFLAVGGDGAQSVRWASDGASP
jgi:hypothetical protein